MQVLSISRTSDQWVPLKISKIALSKSSIMLKTKNSPDFFWNQKKFTRLLIKTVSRYYQITLCCFSALCVGIKYLQFIHTYDSKLVSYTQNIHVFIFTYYSRLISFFHLSSYYYYNHRFVHKFRRMHNQNIYSDEINY